MAVISPSTPYRSVGVSTGVRATIGYLLMAVIAIIVGVSGGIITVGGL